MEIKRKKFQGVKNILSFNRHFYVIGFVALVLILLSQLFFGWSVFLLWIVVFFFLYGLTMPLIVSTYVYDFSKYYNFDWFENLEISDSEKTKILNINAGFDETSFSIKKYYPKSALKVFDFYNSKKHTEPAIKRARKVSDVFPNTEQLISNKIPLDDNTVDAVFLLSAAHEIRNHEEKIQFMKECYRVCKKNGIVVMVEHLRDVPNFMAFTVGFTHFFSKKTWVDVFSKSGYVSINENKFTPFMSIFKLHK